MSIRTPTTHHEVEKPTHRKPDPMLFTIAIILLLLWVLGLVTSSTLGGFLHILLVVAIVMILLRIIQGRRIV